ncbi:MAG: hypothetical protein ACKO0W_12885 [Planctomycetota bacterium]
MRFHTPALVATSASILAIACAAGAVDLVRVGSGPAARADDFLGRSVATDGVRVVAGVPEHDAGAIGGAGAVAVFDRTDGAWTRTALLTASDGATADVLGEWVDLDGGLLIASAANVGLLSPAPWTGAAYIFEREGSAWTQRAKLVPANPSEFMEAGLCAAIDAGTRTAVVAARLDDDIANDVGSVGIYREIGGAWTLEQELHAPDAAPGDAFGFRVAIDGDVLAVATPATDAIAESTGSVYVFERGGRGFVFRTKLMASDAAFRDRFGSSVDVDGDAIAVGAVGDDNLAPGADQGAAYVFRRTAGVWVEEAKLVAGDRAPLDALGASIAIDGDRVLVGAPSVAGGRGAAYLFERVAGGWVETAKRTSPLANPGDALASAVALRGPLLVAGAQPHDFPLTNAGAVFVGTMATPNPADLDGDGVVGATDLAILLVNWG